MSNVGDIDGDGIDDYTATFVAAGEVPSDKFPGSPTPFAEVWNVTIVSAVPVPAALWLFIFGLGSLCLSARRRKV